MRQATTEQVILMIQSTRAARGDRDIFLIREKIFLTEEAPARRDVTKRQE